MNERDIRELMNVDLHKMSTEASSPAPAAFDMINFWRSHAGLVTPSGTLAPDGVEMLHPEEYRRRVERGEIVPPSA